MSRILWSESERAVLEKIRDQVDEVLSCLSILEEVAESIVSGEGSIDEALARFARARGRVKDAQRSVLLKLSEWESRLIDRENLVHLTSKIDDVAGSANFVVSNIVALKVEDIRAVLQGSAFLTMLGNAVRCASVLREAVDGFVKGRDVLGMVDEVDRVEYLVDEDHLRLRRQLESKDCKAVPMPVAIGVSRIIEGVEGVADRSEDAAEILRMIITKLR
ncbi:MAG: DUF47 domain-containing protein [Candidatus Freyarchaeota archaeon]|nr:DUF47 family protein [Candidatus Freyrarchaeum guaymaensis]